MQDRKPSSKELHNKLQDALEAFEASPWRVQVLDNDPSIHIEDDLEELNLPDLDAYWDLVYECIQIAMQNPLKCYAHRTRLKSSYSTLYDQPLWPFKVKHPDWKPLIYFKFCILKDNSGKSYIHIDCHEDRI